MVFSSPIFIFFFLPAVLLLYSLAPKRLKNAFLLAVSYLFYAWGEPIVLFILIASSCVDYIISLRLGVNHPKRQSLIALAIGLNITALLYFKYANFFVGQSINVFDFFGLELGEWKQIALPIGISFFTFQKISYLVDVYRGTTSPAKHLHHYLLYVAFFPQLIAGPIVRYKDIYQQITQRESKLADIGIGFNRFAVGLGKKVLIANPLAQITDTILAQPIDTLPGAYLWVAILAYTFQIYFDFSGYSDMAIGLGRMFGFRFLENFNRPYLSKSVTEFWRRWHISLSNWMRDYLYIPLGGNQKNSGRVYLNLWIVFLLSGLWHGASWNFILWGAFHGAFLSLEKWSKHSASFHLPDWSKQATTFFIVMLGWILFRLDTLPEVGHCIAGMLTMENFFADGFQPLFEIVPPRAGFVFILAILIGVLPIARNRPFMASLPEPVKSIGAWALFALATISLASDSYNPFIYFRF